MKPLSLGKVRALQQLTNEFGVFTIAAFDHRDSFVRMLSKVSGDDRITWDTVVEAKTGIARALAPHVSGVLLDPLYIAGPIITQGLLPNSVGFAVALEESGYTTENEGRVTTLLAGWSVSAIKRMGASAVKLLLYYHPDASTAAAQESIVRQVAAECDTHEIALMVEPICYPLEPGLDKSDPEFARQRPELVLELARRLVPLGIDLLKAEFPTDAAYETDETVMADVCRQLSAITAEIPWALLSAGVDFPTFQRQVEIACQAGASGFVAGRAIWKEAFETADTTARGQFLDTLAISRARILVDTANYRATPWQKRMADRMPTLAEGWYADYHHRSLK